MTAALDKLRYSDRQEFFWLDYAKAFQLRWPDAMLQRVKQLDAPTQEGFWKGEMPKELRKEFRAEVAEFSPAQIVDYCSIQASKDRALQLLITTARREKTSNTGTVKVGNVRLDEATYLLRAIEVGRENALKRYAGMVEQRAAAGDSRFFIRLGKALSTRNRPAEVDWMRCDKVDCWLVENWCGDQVQWAIPPLCLFSDQALADFCRLAFPTTRPNAEVVRQWRRRLGLKRPQAMIHEISVKSGRILFAAGRTKF